MHCNVLPWLGPQGARFCAPIEAVTQVEKSQPFSACRWCRQDQLSYPSQTRPSCHLLVGLMTPRCGGRKVPLGQYFCAGSNSQHPLPRSLPLFNPTTRCLTRPRLSGLPAASQRFFFRVHSSAAGNLPVIKPKYKLVRGHTVKNRHGPTKYPPGQILVLDAHRC